MFGPYFASLAVDGGGKRYVDQTSWDAVIDNFPNWKDNVNGGGYTLSNVVISASTVVTSGNSGFGTGSPARRLHVHNTNPDAHIYLSSRSASILFANNVAPGSSTMNGLIAQASIATDFGRNAGDLLLANYGNARGRIVINANYSGTGTQHVVLQPSAGNVGIGKETPGSKLAVAGLPTYADNAAAGAAGLTAGDFYRTAAGAVMVVF